MTVYANVCQSVWSLHLCLCAWVPVGNICVFISKGPQRLVCLRPDGQGPSGFPSVLPIPSHQHEMLIVRQSGSRRLFGLRAPYRQLCSLICAWVFEGLDFLTIHLRFFSSLTRKSVPLGWYCMLYRSICLAYLCCSEAETLPDTVKYRFVCTKYQPGTPQEGQEAKWASCFFIYQHFCYTQINCDETGCWTACLERKLIQNSCMAVISVSHNSSGCKCYEKISNYQLFFF